MLQLDINIVSKQITNIQIIYMHTLIHKFSAKTFCSNDNVATKSLKK